MPDKVTTQHPTLGPLWQVQPTRLLFVIPAALACEGSVVRASRIGFTHEHALKRALQAMDRMQK